MSGASLHKKMIEHIFNEDHMLVNLRAPTGERAETVRVYFPGGYYVDHEVKPTTPKEPRA